jgi:hypothetical protein
VENSYRFRLFFVGVIASDSYRSELEGQRYRLVPRYRFEEHSQALSLLGKRRYFCDNAAQILNRFLSHTEEKKEKKVTFLLRNIQKSLAIFALSYNAALGILESLSLLKLKLCSEKIKSDNV